MREMTKSSLDMLNLRCCIIQENRDVQPFLAYVGLDAREHKPMGRGASLINMHLKVWAGPQKAWPTYSWDLEL